MWFVLAAIVSSSVPRSPMLANVIESGFESRAVGASFFV